MRHILSCLALALTLTGCVIQPGSPLMALTPPETQEAMAILAQRSPQDVAASEQILSRLVPGQCGWMLATSGRPMVLIRDQRRPDVISVWMVDARTGRLVDIRGHGESAPDGHILLHNPRVLPWNPWQEARANRLYAEIGQRLSQGAAAGQPTYETFNE